MKMRAAFCILLIVASAVLNNCQNENEPKGGYFHSIENPGQCTLPDGKVLSPGEQVPLPNKCSAAKCVNDEGTVLYETCEKKNIPSDCIVTYSTTEPYPDCCKNATTHCPNGNKPNGTAAAGSMQTNRAAITKQ